LIFNKNPVPATINIIFPYQLNKQRRVFYHAIRPGSQLDEDWFFTDSTKLSEWIIKLERKPEGGYTGKFTGID
jgi:hypothetical protein